MRRIIWLGVLAALLPVSSVLAAAQESAPAPAPGPSQEVLRMWDYVGGKLVEMAEDFPEDKYDYRPTPEVRTFAELLLHIAGSSYLFIDTARGQQMGEEDLSLEKYPTKADIVAVLKKSVEEGQSGFWMAQAEHCGEHYGNLVVYYRLNGIVPPASRGSGN